MEDRGYGDRKFSLCIMALTVELKTSDVSPWIQSTLQRRAKIIDFCEHMQDDLLKRVDPILHAKFSAEGIEGQLWGM